MSSIQIAGNTSGTITLDAPNVAGTTTLTLPTTSGTITTKDTNGILSVNGIQFPATQSASADANTLDDYEEGTWTPAAGAQLTVVGTFNSSAKYTKIGRQVTVVGFVEATTSVSFSGTNSQIVNNLPFSSVGQSPGASMNSGRTQGAIIESGSSSIYAAQAMAATPDIAFNITYMIS